MFFFYLLSSQKSSLYFSDAEFQISVYKNPVAFYLFWLTLILHHPSWYVYLPQLLLSSSYTFILHLSHSSWYVYLQCIKPNNYFKCILQQYFQAEILLHKIFHSSLSSSLLFIWILKPLTIILLSFSLFSVFSSFNSNPFHFYIFFIYLLHIVSINPLISSSSSLSSLFMFATTSYIIHFTVSFVMYPFLQNFLVPYFLPGIPLIPLLHSYFVTKFNRIWNKKTYFLYELFCSDNFIKQERERDTHREGEWQVVRQIDRQTSNIL